ncbi:unnamed protein product [Cochlearia groenlandica]
MERGCHNYHVVDARSSPYCVVDRYAIKDEKLGLLERYRPPDLYKLTDIGHLPLSTKTLFIRKLSIDRVMTRELWWGIIIPSLSSVVKLIAQT